MTFYPFPDDQDPLRCSGCYESFSGPWCDNCDRWPCTCVLYEEEEDAAE